MTTIFAKQSKKSYLWSAIFVTWLFLQNKVLCDLNFLICWSCHLGLKDFENAKINHFVYPADIISCWAL